MTTISTHAGDSFVLEITVSFDSGAPVSSLSGATIRASAAGGANVDATTSVTGDVITCTWAAGSLSAGLWRVQVQVTKSGLTQTVYEDTITVLPSNPAAS